MLSSLTRVHRPEPRWPSWLLAVILSLTPALATSPLHGQTTNSQEISSRDVEPTFKLQTERNLVMVRVVVRNSKGAVVDNLRKEDFQLFDKGKPQTIVSFSLEKPALKAAEAPPPKPAEKADAETEESEETTAPASSARRFVAIYFDDVNTSFENLAPARNAADHFLTTSVQPGDRVALYTSSGQKQLDFTSNVAEIHQALIELRPRPVAPVDSTCGAIPSYEAYLIADQNDTIATQVATEEALACCTPGDKTCANQASGMVQNNAQRSLSFSETQSLAALRGIESVARRMTSLPGQRIMVIVSQGFLTETLRFQLSQIADRALRGGVVLNAIDARGLYTDPVTSDITKGLSNAGVYDPSAFAQESQMLRESAKMEANGMRDLAQDTGGIFFENSNDLEAGFRKAAALPEAFYLLAFSPQNLKLNGDFHPIQVKIVALKGLSIQARRGYFAPKKPTDSTQQEKEEIREALFSQDETHELPIDVHTQFFMKSESQARITVLTSIDLRPLQFRKEADRNVDKLTFVTAVFDQDGHEVSAQEKAVDFRMHDSTLERYRQTGITMKTNFDVSPGTYQVRSVVRDSDSGQIAGLNRTVEIPY